MHRDTDAIDPDDHAALDDPWASDAERLRDLDAQDRADLDDWLCSLDREDDPAYDAWCAAREDANG